MTNYACFHELPLTAIRPRGWLRQYLLNQRDGLTGHLEHAGSPFDRCSWNGFKDGGVEHWVPYEQNGYWIDGMIRCGHLLGDRFLRDKALASIDYTLAHADADGYLGPDFLRPRTPVHRWPHAVFFRALMAHHDATGDRRVVQAMLRHYRADGPGFHADGRNVANVEPLLWLHARTGQPWLREHAVEAYRQYNRLHARDDAAVENMLSDRPLREHGVTYNELGKLGAILYMHTGNRRALAATVNAYRKMERQSELISGVCSSIEHLSGKSSLDSHETCDIADYSWGLGYLLLATGEARYADKIEQACFNAAPGAVRADFKALQYFSSPNQVVCDARSNHHELYRGGSWMSYRPAPGTQCCPGEVNRIMPNFVGRMWLSDGQGGLAATCYGPSEVSARVGAGAGTAVRIIQQTDYPFSERIELTVRAARSVRFALHLRIPGWCGSAELSVNGKPAGIALRPGRFARLDRLWRDGDEVGLLLPMALRTSHWPEGGLGILRGPLAYSLKIAQRWEIDRDDPRSSAEFPAWNLYPASDWNYALALDPRPLEQQVQVVRRKMSGQPWTIDSAPIELRVPGRRVKGWKLLAMRRIASRRWDGADNTLASLRGRFTFTPPLPEPSTLGRQLERAVESLTLVPYGCAKMRISVFPYSGWPGCAPYVFPWPGREFCYSDRPQIPPGRHSSAGGPVTAGKNR